MNSKQTAAMRQALEWYGSGNENREEFKQMIQQILEQQPAAWVGLEEAQKVDLASNWLAEDWAITKAVGMLYDYDSKLREKNAAAPEKGN